MEKNFIMSSIVKSEAADDEKSNDLPAIAIKNEAFNLDESIRMEIKQEPELIIDSEFQWSATNLEDEQNEYYQEYQIDEFESDGEGKVFTIQPDSFEDEECSIDYIGEYKTSNDERGTGMDNIDNDSDVDVESLDIDSNSYLKLRNKSTANSPTNVDNQGIGKSAKTFCQHTYLKWVYSNYVHYVCPLCDEKFKKYPTMTTHINHKHKDLIDSTKTSNYLINNTSQAICKQCNTHFKKGYSLLLHSLRHSQPDSVNVCMYACDLCQIKCPTIKSIQNHINEQHPDTKESFQAQNIKPQQETYECPACPAIYSQYNHIRFHFLDKHPKDYWQTYSYPCHLCPKKAEVFDKEQDFFEHLLEHHNLKDWKLMNFKTFLRNTDAQNFSCSKCFKVFFEMDLIKFLKHYLEHENYCRSCRICQKKISHRLQNFYHMCEGLFQKYRSRSKMEKKALTNWQEFEEYIMHVCSFCNKEFETLQNWQIHLRKFHQLDTLKGLDMKRIPKEPYKLKCNLCKTLIENSSVKLHTHRFQHLPFKPYKCRHCSLPINCYKSALNHVLEKCQDQPNQIDQIKTIRESHEMICPLCKGPTFPNKVKILQHYISKHNNFLDFYTKHMDDNTMECKVCQLKLADDANLCRIHVLLHFEQKPHKCLKCSQSFYCRNACLIHVNYHFAKPINQEQKTDENLPEKEQESNNGHKNGPSLLERSTILNQFADFINYACPECNISLASKQLWLEHINENHEFFQEHNLIAEDPANGSFKCIECGTKLTTSVAKQQKHKLIHMPYKSFICNLCCHRCNSLGALYSHLRRAHFAKGSHNCPICPNILQTSYERTEHLKNTHPRSEWPETLCIVCFKTVADEKNMKDHMLSHDIHRGRFDKTKQKCAEGNKNNAASIETKTDDGNYIQLYKVNKRKSNLKSANGRKKVKRT